VQDYVDGTLDSKLALRMHLAAQRDPALQREIDETREMFQALQAVPPAQPSANFDRRVLRSVPLARYASAPRRSPRVLLLGDPTESTVMQALGWVQRLSSVWLGAYLLVAILGRTAVAEPVALLGRRLAEFFAQMADQSSGVGVLHAVAASLASGYDAFLHSFSRVATGQASFLWPATLISLAVLATVLRRVQHRKESPRAAAGHSSE
jgi:anti-sigma factor RsiW